MSSKESAMAARIEHLEKMLAAMADTGASTSTFHEGEYFSYLAIAAQVERLVLGQAMDLNCLTWIVSLNLAEQRRLRVELVVVASFVSSLPTGMVVAMDGGDRREICHPRSSWDVTRALARVAAHAVGDVGHV
ncbi:hypothetical protein AXG93_3882s1020 [Marchantia polymorpha subsp. ruderalis]|uniref:Uncharacterized protein n=1 Tax=Marchantia polymorpha subsp. ruderalis TaxID=1480154 RepID=A0A176W358_MARPO|nr:hypothetical protein AXG93_3882s1020 [Marchantia polymorpha subsp. ruderalis]